jgi:aminotransferase
LPESYYTEVAEHYQDRRDRMVGMLTRAGFRCSVPKGAYYVMADISGFGRGDDVTFVRDLVERVGIAAVPGSSFFSHPELGADWVRFCFPKKNETLDEAERRLAKL